MSGVRSWAPLYSPRPSSTRAAFSSAAMTIFSIASRLPRSLHLPRETGFQFREDVRSGEPTYRTRSLPAPTLGRADELWLQRFLATFSSWITLEIFFTGLKFQVSEDILMKVKQSPLTPDILLPFISSIASLLFVHSLHRFCLKP